MAFSSYNSDQPLSTVLTGNNNGWAGDVGSSLIPASRDAHLLARIFAGQDVTDAEIQAMDNPTCAMIASILIRSKDNWEQQKSILGTLLADNAIDEGPFVAAIFRADPTLPFTDHWPEPIRSNLPAAKPFPLASFPKFVQGFFKDVATSIGCPIDFLGLPALVALGAALGNSCRLQLKPGYEVSGSIYGAIVGERGDRKTAALDVIASPFQLVQNAQCNPISHLVPNQSPPSNQLPGAGKELDHDPLPS
jgi:hypothetical protein